MGYMSNQQMLSKIATNDGHGESSPFFEGWKAYDSDPYHPIESPVGVIQMGLAENQLFLDIIEEWLRKNPKASMCTVEGTGEFRDTAIFQDYHGLSRFRNAVAKFMAKVRGYRAVFDPDRIVMSGGATGAHERVTSCLADPGDAFLVPTPYYAGDTVRSYCAEVRQLAHRLQEATADCADNAYSQFAADPQSGGPTGPGIFCHSSVSSSSSISSPVWVLDSGATHHFCCSLASFRSFVPSENHFVTLSNGDTVPTAGTGSVHLSNDLTLENVLFVPQFRHNLLSISALTQQYPYSVSFYHDHYVIEDPTQGRKIGMGRKSGNLYILDLSKIFFVSP